MNVEYGVYYFLVVEVKTDNQSGKVTLTQGVWTKKVLNKVLILYSNKNTTPRATILLVTYSYGTPLHEPL